VRSPRYSARRRSARASPAAASSNGVKSNRPRSSAAASYNRAPTQEAGCNPKRITPLGFGRMPARPCQISQKRGYFVLQFCQNAHPSFSLRWHYSTSHRRRWRPSMFLGLAARMELREIRDQPRHRLKRLFIIGLSPRAGPGGSFRAAAAGLNAQSLQPASGWAERPGWSLCRGGAQARSAAPCRPLRPSEQRTASRTARRPRP